MKLCKINSLYIVLICALVMTAAGCKKWLVDQDNDPSNLAPDDFYTLPGHADAAIAAAYDRTRFFANGAGIFANNFSMLEMPTGTARTETGQNTDLNNLLGLSYNGDNVFVLNWWTSLYQVIAQTNLVLDRVPAIKMDDVQKKKVLGEAQFLRAWSYFYLVRLYGDVPMLTTSILKVQDPMTYAGRMVKDSVYMQIVTDLKDAEASGLPWTDASGRASMGAVKSLLAEVYLTMAGYPLDKKAPYYQMAADKANEVITSGKFALFGDYNSLHDESKENMGEQIFEIQFLSGVANNGNQAILLPNFKEISAYGTEVGSTTPATQFVNSFEAGDKRTIDRQGFFYTSYYDGGFDTLKQLGAPYIYKHFDIGANGTFGSKGTANSGLNWMNIRYAQVLLTYAEAQNEAGAGPNQNALDALKSIRDRAGLATGTLGSYTQTTFRDAVLSERWHELCYEGVTWFDMVRLRKAYNESNKSFEAFEGHKFPDGVTTLAKKHLLFPLPTLEMQNNPKLRPQNDGYPGVN
ncbi:carbohydrate-binding protein SusD [Niastella yeongjuensis]|uniref:Carbohydrate-binding protein SusD n=1 Tax=Niastella yeongjuensis TaxID=354355 RepID=A0A1V9F763_9BACT|nr:RagB/SusD family nutrient uptake outer membrane protein [Niastella yeongjuensis]OQP54253.1 carbohydrate-binding protein SusD [Niastella yeongjuensis]SEP31254.1 Starch-binding associating with outer membrane [Niastella yeongjuensis]